MKIYHCQYVCIGCDHEQKLVINKPQLLSPQTLFQTCVGCGSKLVIRVKKKPQSTHQLEISTLSLEVSDKLKEMPIFQKKMKQSAQTVDKKAPVPQ